MLGWWLKNAAALQQLNRETEGARGDFYTDDEARRASVHTREDTALIVGLLDALNQQIAGIAILLRVAVCLLAIRNVSTTLIHPGS